MKVLWLSHLLPFPSQGIGVLQRSANLLKSVGKVHDVTLLAFNQNDLLRIYNSDLEISFPAALTEMDKICRKVKVVDIECDKKPYGKLGLAFRSLFSRLPYTIRWLISDPYKHALLHEVNTNEYDLVWFDTISLAQYRRVINSDKLRIILNHHNIESDMMYRRADKERNIFKKLYFYQEAYKLRKYEKNQVSRFDVNVTCSELDSRRLEAISPSAHTYVIPNGVDTEFFSPENEISPNPTSLIFIGGMSWYPNREAMLFFANKVWPDLKKKIPGVSMDVVGESPPQELVDLSAVDENFHVHGFVDDIKKMYHKSGIYVCPISDGGGTKLKILDALAMGMPIVANEIACEGIDVTDGFNVLFAQTPQEYVNKISELISDASLRQKLRENSRKLILDKYSYEVIGNELLALLERNG